MLLLVLYCLLISTVTLPLGAAIWSAIPGKYPALPPPHPALLMVVGLACHTTSAAWLAIWLPLGGLAGWALALAPTLLLLKADTRAKVRASLGASKANWAAWLATLAFASVGLLKAAGPTEVLDDGIGYVPLLEAMRLAGTVIGLGNLQPNWAYNSHINLAAALYGGLPFWPAPLYDINAWLTCLGAWYFFAPLTKLTTRQAPGQQSLQAADLASIALPFFFFRNQMSASSTDLPLSILIWMLILEWVRSPGVSGGAGRAWLLFGLMPAFVFTVKITGAGLVWLTLYVLLSLWALRPGPSPRWLGLLLGIGLVLLPWLIRNMMMTGYLYMLAPGLDLLHPDWRLPPTVLARLADQVAGNIHHAPKHWLSKAWLAQWWQTGFVPSARALLLLAGLGLPIMVYGFIKGWVHTSRGPLVACLVVVSGLILWLASATEERYGHPWICLAAIAAPAVLLAQELNVRQRSLGLLVQITVLVGCMLVAGRTVSEVASFPDITFRPAPYPGVRYTAGLSQAGLSYYLPTAYIRPVTDSLMFYQGKGTASYRATVHCWACPIPCIYHKTDLPYLQSRGPSLRDGYRFTADPPKEILNGLGLPIGVKER